MTNGGLKWLVTPLGYLPITKRCPSCETKKLFYPAEAFRVNAQKKTLDIWNIYKCEKCDYTWNITIFSRININKLDPVLHENFLHNNPATVRHYSYDYVILKKNFAELGPIPDFHVEGPTPHTFNNGSIIPVIIHFEQVIPVRLINLLKYKLCLSRNQILQLIENRVILDTTHADLNKKVKSCLTFRFDSERFQQFSHLKKCTLN